MAREKGTGTLQLEKSGRYTARVSINGRVISRSTGTTDRGKAEEFLNRFLAPFGRGKERVPLADVWRLYEMSPYRREIAKSTLGNKKTVWRKFANWLAKNHLEIKKLQDVTQEAVAEYLMLMRSDNSASTYNSNICILREIFRVLAGKAGLIDDPWEGVVLRSDDSVSRRELTVSEVERLYEAAARHGAEWERLLVTGIYTGLRLGDCCCLRWDCVKMDRRIIQVIPQKTKKHRRGRPVTIPIHSVLMAELEATPAEERKGYVNTTIADFYMHNQYRLSEGLRQIFKAANIQMSFRVEGRRRKCVLASFHSLRHTFVSLSANAGVPIPVVQSIVGHCSTAMTQHYYHENEAVLRQAVDAIPAIGKTAVEANTAISNHLHTGGAEATPAAQPPASASTAVATKAKGSIPARLKRLDKLLAQGVITSDEHTQIRCRILSEL